MKTREETAVEFAVVMGGTLHSDGDGATRVSGPHSFTLPPADAPLPDALAFVGRVADALGIREFAIESPTYSRGDVMFRVTFWGEQYEEADTADAADLYHAAMLAAIEAKRGAL